MSFFAKSVGHNIFAKDIVPNTQYLVYIYIHKINNMFLPKISLRKKQMVRFLFCAKITFFGK